MGVCMPSSWAVLSLPLPQFPYLWKGETSPVSAGSDEGGVDGAQCLALVTFPEPVFLAALIPALLRSLNKTMRAATAGRRGANVCGKSLPP